MLLFEKQVKIKYCNTNFKTCHFFNQNFDNSSDFEIQFWKASDLESKQSQGVRN